MQTHLARRTQRSLPIFSALALLPMLLHALQPECSEASASQSSTSKEPQGRIRVLVSIPPQEWLVESLGGTRVQVESLLNPGDSPETYQPTDAEVTAALRAQLFIPMGVPFERGAWAEALAQAPGLMTLDPPSANLHFETQARGLPHEGKPDHHEHDPHLWLSPSRLEATARQISRALSQLAPQQDDHFRANLDRVLTDLRDLDQDIRSLLNPWRGGVFLVVHPSWTTFAHDFGLQQVAIEFQGHEPSDAELTELIRLARTSGVTTLFVQPAATGRTASAIGSALGLKVQTLAPLARDLPANLKQVTRDLVSSFEDAASGQSQISAHTGDQ